MGLAVGLLLVLQQPIILDGHIDTAQRMLDMKADISARLPDGHVDLPRMQEGGLSAAFFSIWVDARYGPGTAFRRALALIDAVQALVDTQPISVIASHSSCRAIARHPRNLSDAQLRAIAKNGGVVGINFYPVFLDDHFRAQYEELRRRLRPETDSIHARYRGRPGESAFEIDKFVGEQAESLGVPGLDRLVDHIDHAVQMTGIEHAGLGSDFEGTSILPAPMEDATSRPLAAAA